MDSDTNKPPALPLKRAHSTQTEAQCAIPKKGEQEESQSRNQGKVTRNSEHSIMKGKRQRKVFRK